MENTQEIVAIAERLLNGIRENGRVVRPSIKYSDPLYDDVNRIAMLAREALEEAEAEADGLTVR